MDLSNNLLVCQATINLYMYRFGNCSVCFYYGIFTQCIKQIVEAFQRIDSLIQANQTLQLEKDFLSCGSLSEKNDQMVYVNNLANIVQGVVQYNNELPGMNIQSLCKQMTKSDDSYKNLQMVNKVRSIALIIKINNTNALKRSCTL